MILPIYGHHSGWPWPMDAVQDWFEMLWDKVAAIADEAAKFMWATMPTPIKELIGALGKFKTTTWDAMIRFFEDPLGSVKAGFDWTISGVRDLVGWWDPTQGRFVGGFLGWLWDSVSFIRDSISGGLSWVWDQISPALSSVKDAILGFPKLVADNLGNAVGWLKDTVWGWVDGSLRWASDSFRWLADQISYGSWWVVNSVGTMFDGASTIIGDVISGVFSGALGILTGPFNLFLGGFGAVDVTGHAGNVTTIFDGIHSSYEAILGAHSPLTPEDAIIATDTWRSEQRGYWYQLYISALLIEGFSLGQIETPNMMLLSDPQVAASMELAKRWYAAPFEYGYAVRLEQFWNKVYTPQLPPVVDLIRFVVREVIPPERFYELMPYMGFSREFAENYWEAHWVLPAPTVLYDSYHRKFISSEELNKYIVLHDFKPEPRPGITKSDVEIQRSVLKTLIPRVDLRYGWEMGRLSDEELLERYEWLGYEDDSELMTDIQKARAMVEEITKVRDEWIRYFIEGHILKDTLRANLAAIGIGPTRIDYYVTYAKRRREREAMAEWLDIYEDGYIKDLVTDDELDARVREILVEPEAIDLFIARAYIKKYKKPPAPKAEVVKTATLAYLTTAYREDIITESDLRAELERRLYAPADIETIIAVENMKKLKAAGE